VDVAIVGGGIVGITTARLLKDEGMSVPSSRLAASVEKSYHRQINRKNHLAAQHYLHGGARAYAEANEAGLRRILTLASEYAIDCHIETKTAYTYTNDPQHVSDIEQEVEVAQRLGLPASVTRDTGLPLGVLAAMRRRKNMWQASPRPFRARAATSSRIAG
jgi:glycine/D-amino acid oxidase-like deaminating enzyme